MTNDELERDKAVIRRIYEQGYTQADARVFVDCYHPEFVHHSKVIFDVPPGGAGEEASMRRFRQALPDADFRVIGQVAENGWVATRLHITGTPQADYGPVRAGDGGFDTHALALFRLEDGLVIEEWFFVDGGAHGA